MTALSEAVLSTLPASMRCADVGFPNGSMLRRRDAAISYPLIQYNSPWSASWIVADVDYPGAAYAAQDRGAPSPSVSVINPKNGHAHLFWYLSRPVHLTDAARLAPMRLLDRVRYALTRQIGADANYTGLLAKNLFHPDWRVVQNLDAPVIGHDLHKLADSLDMSGYREPRADTAIAEGRNVFMFDVGRRWAYEAVRERRGDSFDLWLADCAAYFERLNVSLADPLTTGEVRAIAKSTAKFCWRNDAQHAERFRARQSFKGRRSGAVRRAASEDARASARLMRASGCTVAAIAAELGVTERTVYMWCKADTLK
jgi:Primase C terminal 1 (PriCT-1)./Putative ATPase subunit of terminase (gpP-like)./Replicase family.